MPSATWNRLVSSLGAFMLVACAPSVAALSAHAEEDEKSAKKEAKAAAKRGEIDAMAAKALADVTAAHPSAQQLLDEAAGHAVFDN